MIVVIYFSVRYVSVTEVKERPLTETLEKISSLWDQISTILISFNIFDLLDICLVAFIVYNAIKLIRETRAIQLAKGMVLLGIVYMLTTLLGMQASNYVFQRLFANLITVLIILFHPEIRHALESMGRSNLSRFSFFGPRNEDLQRMQDSKDAIIEICKACGDLGSKSIGALIVFEKGTPLGEVIKTGTIIDAHATKELTENIFFPMSPLHDGAAIIRAGRIHAAGCILPLTQNDELSHELGTRHRAALGMSELSDAFVVVISEETGFISYACKGVMNRNVQDSDLREKLLKYILEHDGAPNIEKGFFKKLFGGLKK